MPTVAADVEITPENAREQIPYLDMWSALLERDRLAWGLLRHNHEYRREWARAFHWLHRNMRGVKSAGSARTDTVRRLFTCARVGGRADMLAVALHLEIGPRAFRALQDLARRWKVQRLEDPAQDWTGNPVFVPSVSRTKPPVFELSPILVTPPPPEPMRGQVRLTLKREAPWVAPPGLPFDGGDSPAPHGPDAALWLNLWLRLDRSEAETIRAVKEARRAARKERGIRTLRGKRPDYAAAVKILPLLRRRPRDWDKISFESDGQYTDATWRRLSESERGSAIRAVKVRVREIERLVAQRWWEPLVRGA